VRTGVCAYVYACARVRGRIDNNRRARAGTGVYEHLIRACVRVRDIGVRASVCTLYTCARACVPYIRARVGVPYIRARERVYLTHIGKC
jgi:hypothetical protein